MGEPAVAEDNNIQAFLLFLSSEEKKKAQDFISQRLGAMGAEDLEAITCLILDARKAMSQVEAGRARFRGATNNYAKIMARLYDESLVGFAQLLQWSNRAQTAKEREAKNAQRSGFASEAAEARSSLEGQLSCEDRRAFLLEPTEEEENDALAFIQQRVQEIEFNELSVFRDSTQQLLTWWDSTQGQMEGLMLDQFGSINSVQGRRIIRERHEEMKQQTLNPFKAWFQNLNTLYLRKRKEEADRAMAGAPKRPN